MDYKEVLSLAAFERFNGIGPAKTKKYGKRCWAIWTEPPEPKNPAFT